MSDTEAGARVEFPYPGAVIKILIYSVPHGPYWIMQAQRFQTRGNRYKPGSNGRTKRALVSEYNRGLKQGTGERMNFSAANTSVLPHYKPRCINYFTNNDELMSTTFK